MRMRFMLKVARKAGNAAAVVEKWRHRGECTVLKVKCNRCEAWVKPDDWNPHSAVCDTCTTFAATRGVAAGKPVRWIATGKGKPRRKTGVK
jgi:hypothetical protein